MTINIYFGLAGAGKSYVLTDMAVREMLKENGKRVFSNYPIVFIPELTKKEKRYNLWVKIHNLFSKKKLEPIVNEEKLCTYKWENSYTDVPIHDSIIIIDESHERYCGSFAWELTKEDRRFFTRFRHNTNEIHVMSQSYEDIHPFIRRRAAFFHEVTKRHWPFLKKPSCFFVKTYKNIKDYVSKNEYKRNKKAGKTEYKVRKVKFTDLVGNAYNTHYFRDTRPEPEFMLWTDYFNKQIVIENEMEEEQDEGVEI